MMTLVSLSSIELEDDFWTPYYLIHKDVTLPLAESWTERFFDPPMVAKAVEGMAYSLQFEKDPELAVRRGTWVTRLKNETGSRLAVADTCEVSRSVTKVFNYSDMLRISSEGKYVDNLEQTLYNEVLPGISLKGDSFFSESPSSSDGGLRRKTWDETPGAAMDLFRVVPYVGNTAYGTSKKALWVNLFIGGEAKVRLCGEDITVRQTTSYPWDGYVALRLGLPRSVKAEVRLRVPSWCEDFTITVNGGAVNVPVVAGYAVLDRKWQDGDTIEMVLDMPVETVRSLPGKEAVEGLRAVRRGPVYYCAEEVDNTSFYLADDISFRIEKLPNKTWWGHELTKIIAESPDLPPLTMVPYFAWGNREPGWMRLLIPIAIK
ncbi:MAG: glycoside hydrolase family 127 protein [Bacteroidales bacterium]|nr:glycoside hydrolase family 127 protein [Bacteroidales bacterium]